MTVRKILIIFENLDVFERFFVGLIYLVGGHTNSGRYLHDFLSYNPLTREWLSLPAMSTSRSQIGVAVLDDYLYVVGGDNRQKVLNTVERYSFKKVAIKLLALRDQKTS